MSVVLWYATALTQITTASVSFIASLVIAIMIFRSDRTRTAAGAVDGGSPLTSSLYHRIIFGLSISDIFHSFTLATGPFAAPSSVPQALWGVGNVHTCGINGFFSVLGSTATPMYVLMLCLYCLVSVRKKTTTTFLAIKREPVRLEMAAHIFIILFNICLSSAGLQTKSINAVTTGTSCGFAAYPTGCRQRPDLFGECDEAIARHASIFIFISYIAVPFVCLVGIIVIMLMICWDVLQRNKLFFKGFPTKEITTPSKETQFEASLLRRKGKILQHSHSLQDRIVERLPIVERNIKCASSGDSLRPSPVSQLQDNNDESGQLDCQQFPTMGTYQNIAKRYYDHALEIDEEKEQKDNDNSVELACLEETGKSNDVPPSISVLNSNANPQNTMISTALSSNVKPPNTTTSAVLMRIHIRDIVIQAFLFIAAFFVTFIFWWVSLVMLVLQQRQPPIFLVFLVIFFYPLGGLLNILVFTRPKVISLMKQQNSKGFCSWLRAFFLVVKAGCTVPVPDTSANIVDVRKEVSSRQFLANNNPTPQLVYIGSSALAGDCVRSESSGDENGAYSRNDNRSHDNMLCTDELHLRITKESNVVGEDDVPNSEESGDCPNLVNRTYYQNAYQRIKVLQKVESPSN